MRRWRIPGALRSGLRGVVVVAVVLMGVRVGMAQVGLVRMAQAGLVGAARAVEGTGAIPDVVLSGTISPEKLGTHQMLHFTVPRGVERMTVTLDSPGFAKGMYLTVGMFDPERYRGEGRGSFTIATVDATGPYLPGPLVAGVWTVAIGYNWVAPGAKGEFSVRIHMSRRMDPETYPVRNAKAGWYRGDLHAHTGRTDAMCRSQAGVSVPCPPYRLLAAAAGQGLDFLAVTDHNTQAHFDEMRQDAVYFDRMVLIAAEEVTTVRGHANVWGTEEFLDYRVGMPGYGVNDLFNRAHQVGALVSINHAYWPYDGRCPGCGWGWADTDFGRVDAIEVVNGYHERGSWFAPPAGNGVAFWEAQLARGYRITAVGGGDEHRAGEQLAEGDGVGIPTTVVWAAELSQPGILAGVKAGHVYVRATGPDGPELLLTAGTAMMGDAIAVGAGGTQEFEVVARGAGAKGARVRVYVDGRLVEAGVSEKSGDDGVTAGLAWRSDGGRHWVRAELVGVDGGLVALTNPVYVNWGLVSGTGAGR